MKKSNNQSIYTRQFWLLCLSSVLFMGSFNMIIPELNQYITQLGAPDKKGFIISAFALAALLARPLSGKLTDKLGRIPIMIVGVIVCIVLGLIYPLFTTVWGFLFLRFLHGFSSGFKPTATTAYMADIIHSDKRGEAMGILGISGSIGMAGGPFIGSWIAQHYGMNAMFYASSLVAFFSIMVLFGMKETLVVIEKFSFQLFKIGINDVFEPKVIVPGIIMFLTIFSFGTNLTLIPDFSDYLQVSNRGTFFSFMLGSSIVTRIIAGKASDKFGRIIMLQIGTLLLVVGMLFLGFVTNFTEFVISAIILGVSAGINSPTLFAWNIDLAKDENRGRAMSTLFITLEAGIILGAYFSAFVYNNNTENFKISFWISASIALLAFIFLLFYKNRKTLR